ncbi:sigma-54 dependent transcriptional regulator [Paeniclostridium sordellii]|uniref:sigma-54-dependent transcriptional regulator n=1 Tax=Paraclostridium sordellii TaxID=1505 RepID=UPI0005E92EE9|nr:sigma-54 dependent transcriptional regulator [Paeniclostridium sordellii]MCH1966414.1 sigma-54 dependent transcriptional regulator [Paeniclostridium sordellii]MCQ4696953.1 sigma-54 dependent transcriptional regulator [Paeniclostridium sordellii]CEN83432.1 two-component response regulator [[Clostridium] sordellii] [Paeniclostridium sordellii]CEO10984.1 two-component response regulator [[Clostridium] sordellii] [Paeniclostridium sordellii]
MKILIVDDEIEYANVMKKIIKKKGYEVNVALSGLEAISIIEKDKSYDLVLSDLIMDKMNGVELLENVKIINKDIEVILVTGYGTIENAVDAMKKGAFSYFIKSNPTKDLLNEIQKVKESIDLKSPKKTRDEFKLTTKSKKFKDIIKIAEKVAISDINILILGESGVGKDVLARYIHNLSNRKDNTFVAVNCCAFSDGLLESELFGHEKGAFTGANERRKGRFELANRGTLFLDEIGDVSLDVQVKLLRTLENGIIERLGSNKQIKSDFRLISATNKNFKEEIEKGSIREDFFYRISTISITIPPLRERKEDLNELIKFFIKKYEYKYNKKINKIDSEIMDFLTTYDYPGNIRELKNIINRMIILSENGKISKECLPSINKNESFEKITIKPLKEIRKEFECEYIEKVLIQCGNNISQASKKLDISRRQLTNKIAEYKLR